MVPRACALLRCRNRPRGITVPVLTVAPSHTSHVRKLFPRNGIAVRKGQKGWGGKPLRAWALATVDSSRVIVVRHQTHQRLMKTVVSPASTRIPRCRWASSKNLQGSAPRGVARQASTREISSSEMTGPDPGRHVEMIIVAHVGSFACARRPSWKKCLRPTPVHDPDPCVGRRIASPLSPSLLGLHCIASTPHRVHYQTDHTCARLRQRGPCDPGV